MVKASEILLPCLCTLALMAGCSGNRQAQTTAPSLTAADNQGGPWFCQPATVAEEWECDNDPGKVENPIPDRKPQMDVPDLMPEPLASDVTPNAPPLADPALPAITTDPDSGVATGAAATEPVAAGDSSTGTNNEAEAQTQTQTQADTSSGTLPNYKQLAYQPPAPVSLLELPPDYFAVQLTAMSSAAQLEQFFRETELEGLSAAQVERDGELFYILLLGIYESFSRAEQAATDLPPPLDGFDPWIRRLGTLQAAMIRAEQLQGQDPG